MALENSLRFLASSPRSLRLGSGFGSRDLKMFRRWRFDGRRVFMSSCLCLHAPWDDVLDVEDLHFWAAKDGDAAGGFFRKPGVNKRVALELGFVPVVDATYAGHMRLLNES